MIINSRFNKIYLPRMIREGAIMEEAFRKLEKDGQNSVDNLIAWMKDSKVIDTAQDSESKARKLFDDAKDKGHVELAKFKQVLKKLAAQQHRSAEDLARSLSQTSLKMQRALEEAANAAAEAFKKAMTK